MNVLITNASYKNTLAAVRSLGEKGVDVTVAGEKKFASAFFSKYCRDRKLYTSPTRNHTKFVKDILQLVEKGRIDLLFPVGVDTTVPISYCKEKFLPYTEVPIADYETLAKAHEKPETLKLAKKLGIPVPETFFPRSIEEVEKISRKVDYPVIIKRRRGSGVKQGIRYVRSKDELVPKYNEIESLPSDSLINEQKLPMIQEYIPGEIRDVCVLFNNGKPRAALVQRRIWTWPPEGGPGILNETISDPHIRSLALKLMEKIRWHGLAQVEFKLDSEGKPKLMEVNPKFWGTLELSIKAGIDFPYLLYKMTVNGDIDPLFTYQNRLKIMWLFPRDVYYLLKAPSRIKNLTYFIKLLQARKTTTDISFRDLKPEFIKLLSTIYQLAFL